MTLDEMKAKFSRCYVRHGGIAGPSPDSPVCKVWRVTSRGIWVTMPNGERQQWHPDDCYIAHPNDNQASRNQK